MERPVTSFLARASNIASTVAGAAKSAASVVAEKVDDHIDTMRGGHILVGVKIVDGIVTLAKDGDQFLEIDPTDYDRV